MHDLHCRLELPCSALPLHALPLITGGASPFIHSFNRAYLVLRIRIIGINAEQGQEVPGAAGQTMPCEAG